MATQRLSNWVALRCKEPAFRFFLRAEDEAAAVSSVRSICGVVSRRELDTDPAAARRFHTLIRLPYSQFVAANNYSRETHV